MKYEVKHVCGHVVDVDLLGPTSERVAKLEWLKTTLCLDCYRSAKNAEIVKASDNLGLADLTGSEKQIEWAKKIRIEKIIEMRISAKNAPKAIEQYIAPAMDAVLKIINLKTDAKFWIDNREKINLNILLKNELKKVGVN